MGVEITLEDCAASLLAADNILVLTHTHPDGDTLGSAAGLVSALRSVGKTAYIRRSEIGSKKLEPYVAKYFEPENFSPEFVCAVDVASEGLFPAESKVYCGKTDLCIDHHGSNERYAARHHIEKSAACSEIVFELVKLLGAKIDAEIALPLYLGISTDTGCFRYSSVTPHTHRVAAELTETGIDFYDVNQKFFETKSRAQMALESAVIAAAEFYRGGEVVVSHFSLGDLERIGAVDDDTPGISSMLRTIEGVRLSVLLREADDRRWRVSMRSVPGVDSSKICARMGGGGHAAAAGATLGSDYEAAHSALLDAVRAEIGDL